MKVLDEVKVQLPETKEFIEERLEKDVQKKIHRWKR